MISAWRSDDEERVTATLQQARFNIMSHLAAAAQESYARAYPFWAQLQLLNDFDLARTRVTASVSWPWQQRIASMQPAFTTREPILSVHRLVFEVRYRFLKTPFELNRCIGGMSGRPSWPVLASTGPGKPLIVRVRSGIVCGLTSEQTTGPERVFGAGRTITCTREFLSSADCP